MANPTKVTGNPDTQLTPDELVARLNQQTEQIAKALEPLADIKRDTEGKETKPPTDVAGLTRRAAQAYASQFKTEMKVYGANGDIAMEVSHAATALRKKLAECLTLAREMQEHIKDAEINRDTQAKAFAAANAPKIDKLIAKEDERARKSSERKAKLLALKSGTAAPKAKKATA